MCGGSFPNSPECKQELLVSIGVLTAAVAAVQLKAEYPSSPRVLAEWQREALFVKCPRCRVGPGRITFLLGTAPGALEAEDYARQLMEALNVCKADVAYGYDPYPQSLIVNEGKVIVPPTPNMLLRVSGVELWMLDPSRPNQAAKQMAEALDSAGIHFVRRPDIRLGGIAALGEGRFLVDWPQCVLMVGTKPLWSWRVWLETEHQHLRFCSQYPADENRVMAWAVFIYALGVFSARVSLLVINLRHFIARRFIAR